MRGDDAARLAAADFELADRAMLVNGCAGALCRHCQSTGESPVLDLVVIWAQHRSGDARPQVGLAPPRFGARHPFDREPECLLELVGEAQLLGVVAGQRDDDRALVAIADPDAGGGFDLAREIRPQVLAFEGEPEQRFFAGLGLDRGSEHSGRRPAGAVPSGAPVIHGDGAAGLR